LDEYYQRKKEEMDDYKEMDPHNLPEKGEM